MNKEQAKKIATMMVKKRVSAYAGKYSIAVLLDVDVKKVTPTVERKVLTEFYKLILEDRKHRYPAIEQLYAEEELTHE